MTVYLAVAGAFGLIVSGVLTIYQIMFGERIMLKKRVDSVVTAATPVPIRQQELSAPLYQRAVKPMLKGLSRLLSRALPVLREDAISRKLQMGGNPGNLAPMEFMVIKYLLAVVLAFCAWRVSGLFFNTMQSLAMCLVGLCFGWLVPDVIVNSRIARRKDEVERCLPDVLDLLTISVEAGLGFDGALMKVVEKFKGVLADEFYRLLQEVKLGKPRRDALREMSERLGVDDFSNFVGSIVMAEQLGVSMGNILRIQSRDIRLKRRQRIQEMAMKAPVKMLFPLVFFIFPTLFVVILGPAVIQIFRLFLK
jgi:tight adherence protein C